MLKKLTFSFLTSLTLLLTLVTPSAHAQGLWYIGDWYNQGPIQWHSKVYDSTNPQEIFGERYTAAQVQWIIYSLFSVGLHTFISPDVINCFTTADALGSCTQEAQNVINRLLGPTEPTALNATESNLAEETPKSFLSTVFADRPLSGVSYVKGKLAGFHVVPEVQAQTGFGYGAFTFIQGLWAASRNVTYGLMILIIIAMAFMIMFRTKISPQAVITVQSALPKIVITLILITFSYAIAGFAVDLMYVVLGLISLIFTSSGIFTSTPQVLFDQFTTGNIGLGLFGTFVLYWFRFMAALIGILFLPDGFGATIAFFTGTSPLIFVIMTLVLCIVLGLISFKALWVIIKTFINIILLVIAGPFMIAIGALSSGSGGFSGWIRALAAELAVYPAIAVLTSLSFVFLAAAFAQSSSVALPFDLGVATWMFGVDSTIFSSAQTPWAPPLTFGTGELGLPLLWLFASLGCISLIPRVSEIIKSWVAGKPFGYGSAIGEAFGPVGTLGKMGRNTGIGTGTDALTQYGKSSGRKYLEYGAQAINTAFGIKKA
jgi:hypothetical protein